MPEAKLAREAEIAYATVAMVTDYDCWHPEHDSVTVENIIKILHSNSNKAKILVNNIVKHINNNDWKFDDPAYTALDNAIITPPEARPTEALSKIYNIAKRLI